MSLSEMTSFLPVRGAMHRFAGAFVDPALGFASSVNYWLLTVTMLCVEINALTSVLLYWVDESKLHVLNILIPLLMLAVYFVLNVWDTRFFGEAEFWTSVFKCLLAIGLLVMTVFLMCGANPRHDAFGFRYWKHPGPMNEYLFPGGVGRFCSVVAAIVSAAFTFQGPDMVSNVAGDARFPRRVIPRAFKSVNLRLMVFFIGSALAVGILVPYNDPVLVNAINHDSPGASRTAWVRALDRLGVKVLPDIINAVILTSIFSCGNANVFAGARALQSMATEGMLPRVVGKTNRNGVPYVAVCICLAIGLLSLMQVSGGSSQVLFYFFDITTSSLVVTWVIVSLTHICWRRAIKLQSFPVESLPYSSRLAPYASWYSFGNALLVLLICGWDIFTKGNWSSKDLYVARSEHRDTHTQHPAVLCSGHHARGLPVLQGHLPHALCPAERDGNLPRRRGGGAAREDRTGPGHRAATVPRRALHALLYRDVLLGQPVCASRDDPAALP